MPDDKPQSEDWRVLAERVASEQDPQKLTEIVEALCHVLEEPEQRQSEQKPQRPRGQPGVISPLDNPALENSRVWRK